MLEALLFAAGISVAAANPQAQPPAVPSSELLEFIADWPEPEAHQILDVKRAKAPLPSLEHSPAKTRKVRESRNEH